MHVDDSNKLKFRSLNTDRIAVTCLKGSKTSRYVRTFKYSMSFSSSASWSSADVIFEHATHDAPSRAGTSQRSPKAVESNSLASSWLLKCISLLMIVSDPFGNTKLIAPPSVAVHCIVSAERGTAPSSTVRVKITPRRHSGKLHLPEHATASAALSSSTRAEQGYN